jgi:putative membrane-bound dehydrogenase-like protein
MMRLLPCCTVCTLALSLAGAAPSASPTTDTPQASDPRIIVERFASAPNIVHPIALDFDARGRLLVIESHTHFRPSNYKGPPADRIRVLEDTDGDGKADRFTTFFEGTRSSMDLAVHPDGSVYLATRNEVLRLRDTDGDGKADEKTRIVFLDTPGDYPHNGLSGLSFDSKGDLYFGMGENLGAGYKLIGADGTTLTGGGEGGNIFWCTADGKGLRRVATGFWNPFGTGRDIFGRLFAVDNDPDAMPPCRLLHVVEGGDYGYQFRYGRSGRHPFQSWNGQLPGTLPMASGTGEAPCEVLSYESDGLPAEYVGDLLVTSWADHRVERYALREHGASVTAERKPFVQGGKDFRPVGLAVAPDGSLFVSDWVLSDYNLHGRGAVWHIRMCEPHKPDRPKDPRRALLSMHRPLREAAARTLAGTAEGRDFLRERLADENARVRAAALTALIDSGDRKTDLEAFANKETVVPLKALAVRGMVGRGVDLGKYLKESQPAAVWREAIASIRKAKDAYRFLLNIDPDAFLRTARVHQLAQLPEMLDRCGTGPADEPAVRIDLLLAHRASGRPESVQLLPRFLADPDDEVRFLAAKWIADEKLSQYRPQLVDALKNPRLNVRLFFAYSAALARIDGRDVNETKMADYFLDRLRDSHSPLEVRILALQMVPANDNRLTLDLLGKLLAEDYPALQCEVMRTLAEHPSPRRLQMLLDAALNDNLADEVRAEAIVGLAEQSQQQREALLKIACGTRPILRDEALRALVNTQLSAEQRMALEKVAKDKPEAAPLVARALGKPFAQGRPAAGDLDTWLKRLEGPADTAAGRRVFAHSKLGGCVRCHRVEGRGQDVGPDLSTIGRTERRSILESILQPSNLVAPHYQVWQLETADGRTLTGMLLRTELDEYTYLDAKGGQFKLRTTDIVENRPLSTSIMPDGLAELMTDQELRDLLAYLCLRR